MKITCSGCGQSEEIPDTAPLAAIFQYHCRFCLSPKRRRLKYKPNVEAQRKLKARLETFVDLPLLKNETGWFELSKDLGIDVAAVEQLVAVIKEGKWRGSTAPRSYLQTTVKRRFTQEADMSGFFLEGDDPPVAAGNLPADPGGIHMEYNPRWQSAVSRKGKAWQLLQKIMGEPTIDDLRAVDQLLTRFFDKDEAAVVKTRASGVSRDRYLDSAHSSEERLRRQAAWKRVDRKGLPEGLRDQLKRSSKTRLLLPAWEDRGEEDAVLDRLEQFNEFDPESSYGTGGGRRKSVAPRE